MNVISVYDREGLLVGSASVKNFKIEDLYYNFGRKRVEGGFIVEEAFEIKAFNFRIVAREGYTVLGN